MCALKWGGTIALGLVLSAMSCSKRIVRDPLVAGGDAQRGAVAIQRYGCGSCHLIPGIQGARGTTGPPLTHLAAREYVAGVLPNRPDNLVHWIMNPPLVDSLTAMPFLGVSESEARDIAQYLYEAGR